MIVFAKIASLKSIENFKYFNILNKLKRFVSFYSTNCGWIPVSERHFSDYFRIFRFFLLANVQIRVITSKSSTNPWFKMFQTKMFSKKSSKVSWIHSLVEIAASLHCCIKLQEQSLKISPLAFFNELFLCFFIVLYLKLFWLSVFHCSF